MSTLLLARGLRSGARRHQKLAPLAARNTEVPRRHQWAPAAYRSKKTPTRYASRRRAKKQGGTFQDNVWKQLQSSYDDQKAPPEKKTHSSILFYLHKLQTECLGLIEKYQTSLFPSNVDTNNNNNKKSVQVALSELHEQSSSDDSPSWTSILETEDVAENLDTILKKLIFNHSIQPWEKDDTPPPSVVAEQLLQDLNSFSKDRAQVVQRAHQAEQARIEKKEQESKSWTGWITSLVSSATEEEEEEKEASLKDVDTLVHSKDSFGPRRVQFQQVIQCMEKETKCMSEDEIKKQAHRMMALLQLLQDYDIVPTLSLVQPIMETHAKAASLDNALQAERIYSELMQQRVPKHVFCTVLDAHCRAALRENENAAQAAKHAQRLLRDRVTANEEAYAIVLETLRAAKLPDMYARSERIIMHFVGKDRFDQVITGKASSSNNLQVFEPLLCMYAESGDDKLLGRAKNILKCAEESSAETKSFPTLQAYSSVLQGILDKVKQMQRNIRKVPEHHAKQRLRASLKEEADYATKILENMVILPTHDVFSKLLLIWRHSKLPESGQKADEILSRWSLLRAGGGPCEHSGNLTYYALQCWTTSAEASFPGSLQRALRVLNREEARCGINHSSLVLVDSYNDAEKEIFHKVYEQSRSLPQTYTTAIKLCSYCRQDADTALEAAFDVYNRMIAAGVLPEVETFLNLLSCCANLLPEGSKRRYELAETVAAFASAHDVATDVVANKMYTDKLRRFKGKRKKKKSKATTTKLLG